MRFVVAKLPLSLNNINYIYKKWGLVMIQHFSFKPLFENSQLPGWSISFFYQRERYSAEYLKDGVIQWNGAIPPNEEDVKKMIHELMLYHVYD